MTWGNGDKLKHGKFHLPIKKTLLFSEDSEESGPESAVSSSLGSLELKWAMAWALGDLL